MATGPTRKPTSVRSTGAASAAETAPQGPAAVPEIGQVHVELKMKDLLDRVVTVTGGKRSEAKIVAEAVLAQMGASLAEGHVLNLPALGKMRVVRANDKVLTLKLRLAGAGRAEKPGQAAAEPLADAGEAG